MAVSMKAMRVNVCMTRKSAAELIGITEDQLYNFESGRTSPDVVIAYKMAQVYGCHIDDIDFLRSEDTKKA